MLSASLRPLTAGQATRGSSESTRDPAPAAARPHPPPSTRKNLQWTPTHLNPFIAKLLFNNYITVPTVFRNEISMSDISENIKL